MFSFVIVLFLPLNIALGAQFINRYAFAREGHRRRTLSSTVITDPLISISVNATVISHRGAVAITVLNSGSTTNKPSNLDWIACYSPANSDITKTTPIRYQVANWTGTWYGTQATSTVVFNLNNIHTDYACYLFNGGLAGPVELPPSAIETFISADKPGQDSSISKDYGSPFNSIVGKNATFKVLAGPSATVSFDIPNLPTHVRTLPGKSSMSFNFVWNQVTASFTKLMPAKH